MVLLSFRRGSASPPKRCLRSLFRLILPAIEQIRSDPVTPTRLRDVPALDCGYVVQAAGFKAGFFGLSALALVAMALLWIAMPETLTQKGDNPNLIYSNTSTT
jgi:hypothetical protein